jgi:hypothetical protein
VLVWVFAVVGMLAEEEHACKSSAERIAETIQVAVFLQRGCGETGFNASIIQPPISRTLLPNALELIGRGHGPSSLAAD